MKLIASLTLLVFAATAAAQDPALKAPARAPKMEFKTQSASANLIRRASSNIRQAIPGSPEASAVAAQQHALSAAHPTQQPTLGTSANRKICRVDGSKIYYCR